MKYVLDTDTFTLSQLPNSPFYLTILSKAIQLPEDDLTTSIITYEEQTRGWLAFAAKSKNIPQRIEAYRRLHTHLDSYKHIPILDFDQPAGREFERLTAQKIRIGTSDLKIAAIVLANDATLVSRNLRDFQRVLGLKVEDWTRD